MTCTGISCKVDARSLADISAKDRLEVRHPDGKFDSSASENSEIVLLIGSTGALGANMLSVLLATESISHVYCLNRAPESGTLQVARSKALGLSTEFPDTRVTFLTIDLTSPDTSFVPSSHYATIASTVTLVIHAAWPVDSNLTLTSFSSSLTCVSSLASLTASSHHHPSIHLHLLHHRRAQPFPTSDTGNNSYLSKRSRPYRIRRKQVYRGTTPRLRSPPLRHARHDPPPRPDIRART